MVNITGTTTWEAPRNPWKSCGRSWNCRSRTPSDFLLLHRPAEGRSTHGPREYRYFFPGNFQIVHIWVAGFFVWAISLTFSATSNVPFKISPFPLPQPAPEHSARAANRTDACFIRVIGSELVQKYVGEGREWFESFSPWRDPRRLALFLMRAKTRRKTGVSPIQTPPFSGFHFTFSFRSRNAGRCHCGSRTAGGEDGGSDNEVQRTMRRSSLSSMASMRAETSRLYGYQLAWTRWTRRCCALAVSTRSSSDCQRRARTSRRSTRHGGGPRYSLRASGASCSNTTARSCAHGSGHALFVAAESPSPSMISIRLKR